MRESLGRGICFVALGALLTAGGCSPSPSTSANQKPVHPVKGQVFFGNQPAVGAFVLFIPKNETQPPQDPRPRAEVKDDGSFALSTYGSEDGAPAGEYVVTITWSGTENDDKLQGRYSDPAISKLSVTIKEGQNEVPAFKL